MLCVVGDVCEDIVVWPDTPIVVGADTTARIVRRRGGSAANVAVFAAAAGTRARFVGRVGDDVAATRLVAELVAAGVDVVVERDPSRATGTIVVLVDGRGERTMITARGAAEFLGEAPPGSTVLASTVLESNLVLRSALDDVTWLHIPFYSLNVEPLRTTTIALIGEARRRSIPVSVDASSSTLLERFGVDRAVEAVGRVDVLFANEVEAAVLQGRWPAPIRITKQGRDPAIVDIEGPTGTVSDVVPVAAAIDAVDSTGAGDAFAAGFIAARLAGNSVHDAVVGAHTLAARVLGTPGASLSP